MATPHASHQGLQGREAKTPAPALPPALEAPLQSFPDSELDPPFGLPSMGPQTSPSRSTCGSSLLVSEKSQPHHSPSLASLLFSTPALSQCDYVHCCKKKKEVPDHAGSPDASHGKDQEGEETGCGPGPSHTPRHQLEGCTCPPHRRTHQNITQPRTFANDQSLQPNMTEPSQLPGRWKHRPSLPSLSSVKKTLEGA